MTQRKPKKTRSQDIVAVMTAAAGLIVILGFSRVEPQVGWTLLAIGAGLKAMPTRN